MLTKQEQEQILNYLLFDTIQKEEPFQVLNEMEELNEKRKEELLTSMTK